LEDTLPYLFALLRLGEGDDPLAQMDPQVRRRRTHDAIKRILLKESRNQPLMLIFEDLHWIDSETQALLNLLVDAVGTARVLLLVNYRLEYRHEWGNRTHYSQIRLDPLSRENAGEMLDALLSTPATLSKPLARSFAGEGQGEGSATGDGAGLALLKRLIIERTEGNPFFMEEMVQVLFDEGALVRNGGVKLTRPLAELKIPPTVQTILSARIDRLPAAEKELLQTLAVIGEDLLLELVKAVTNKSEEQLEPMLSDLQAGEFIYELPAAGDVEYTFKHALTYDVAYNSLLQGRRKALHECVGAALEALHNGRLDEHLDHLAHHFHRSDNAAKAVEYLRLAGEQSARRSSPKEAIAYLREALGRTKALPAGERDRAELAVQFALGSALTAESWGAPEKMRTFERVSELAARTGAGVEVFPALWHLAEAYITQEKLARGHELAQQSLRVAVAANDRRLLLGGHYAVAEVAFWSGNFPDTQRHGQQAIELCDRAADQDLALYYGMDPFALSCVMLAFAEPAWADAIAGSISAGTRGRVQSNSRTLTQTRSHSWASPLCINCSGKLGARKPPRANSQRSAASTDSARCSDGGSGYSAGRSSSKIGPSPAWRQWPNRSLSMSRSVGRRGRPGDEAYWPKDTR
jgi:predicted ATPase